MSDQELREHERRWKETGAVEDHVALLQARVRAGEVPKEVLALHASLDSEAAYGKFLAGGDLAAAAWVCIESWFARAAPGNLANLARPARPKAAQGLADQLGVKLPAALLASWACHDGQRTSEPRAYEELWELLSVERAFEEWDMLTGLFDEEDTATYWGEDAKQGPHHPPELKFVIWSSKWLPIASEGNGDNICLDFTPTSSGRVGQVFRRTNNCSYTLLAPSLEVFLADYGRRLLNEEFVADKDGDLFRNDEQGKTWMADMAEIKARARKNEARRKKRKTKAKKATKKATKKKAN